MTKREKRVIDAFINCVKTYQYTADYAILLIEDNARYGWLSEEAKEVFYAFLDEWEAAQEPAEDEPVAEETAEDAPENENTGNGFGV